MLNGSVCPLIDIANFLVYQVLLQSGENKVISTTDVPGGHHVPPDYGEMLAAEAALLNDPTFKEAITKFDLPSNAKVVADGWIYGMSPPLN